MRHRWRLRASNGVDYATWYDATEAYDHNPALTFNEEWFEGGKWHSQPATENVRRLDGVFQRRAKVNPRGRGDA